jgi:hypothetical protein
MALSASAIVVMVIRKYSVGHLDNAQQKVQFVKLLGSTHTRRGISYFDAEEGILYTTYMSILKKPY